MTRAMQYRIFWQTLSFSLDAGLPILHSLKLICWCSEEDKFNTGIKRIIEDLKCGKTFSDAMAVTGLFSRAEVNIIRAGEVSDMLEIVCGRLARGQVFSRADQYQFFYQMLGSLLQSGVPELTALQLITEKLDEELQKAVRHIYDSIKDGNTISDAMRETGEFSPLEVTLVDVGEETGNLDAILFQLAKMSRPFDF